MEILGKGAESVVIRAGSYAKKATNQNEIDILNRLGYHPNIIQPETILGTTLYMPIADQDLFDYVKEDRLLEEYLDIFAQIVKAVEWCHANHIIHHDIKMENVLMFGSTAVLIDFGLSVYTETKIKRKSALGTEDYAAPEILDHLPYDQSSDVWSLGILLFLLVTGKQPWEIAKRSDWSYDLFLKNRKAYWKWFDKYYKTEEWFKDLFVDLVIGRIPPIEILKRIKTLKVEKND